MSSTPETASEPSKPPPPAPTMWLKAVIGITSVAWLVALGMMFLTYQMQQNAVYQSSIVANPLSIFLSGGATSRPRHVSPVQASAVVMVLTLVIGLPMLYVRKRVSLLSLLLLMLAAGALGVVPRLVLSDAPRGGVIDLRENFRSTDQELSAAEIETIRRCLQPPIAFSTLPPDIGRDLGITPDMVESVELKETETPNGQGFNVFLHFRPGLTSGQSGTLFHFYSALIHITSAKFYADKLPPNVKLEVEASNNDGAAIMSRFGKVYDRWRQNLESTPEQEAVPSLQAPPKGEF